MTLSNIASVLKSRLNTSENIKALDGFEPNTHYRFRILEDEGEYKGADRDGNEITKYINGILVYLGDDKNISGSYQTLIWTETASARLDLLVPDIDLERINNVGERETLEGELRQVLDSAFGSPYVGGSTSNTTYTFSYASTGEKDIREAVGNSLTLTVFINTYTVNGGVSSSQYYITLNGTVIHPIKLDISRTSTQFGYVRSDNENSASKVRNEGTSLVIGVTKPVTGDALDDLIADYILTEDNEPFTITLSMNGRSRELKVAFSDAADCSEAFTVASTTCTLVEYLDI